MKLLLKIGFAAALMLATSSFGEGIGWHGKWNDSKRSMVIPIIGNVDESTGNLSLEFMGNLGNVIVTVTDNNGNIVCQESVQTNNVPNVIIPLTITEGTVSVTDGENLVYGFINF